MHPLTAFAFFVCVNQGDQLVAKAALPAYLAFF